MTGSIPESVRHMVEARSGGVCERCGGARATDKHHRLFRSRLGLHVVENLVDLCGPGNVAGCHGFAHQRRAAEVEGFSIRSGGDPLLVPVQHAVFGLVLLTAEGGWKPVSDAGVGADMDAWESPISAATKVASETGWV